MINDPRDDFEEMMPGTEEGPSTEAEEPGGGEARERSFGDDVADGNSEIDALRAENAALRDRLLREMAEMENLRKRTQREKQDASRFAITNFARDVLTIGDDLRRAVDAAPPEARDKSDDPAAQLLSGIELTERQLIQALERHGIKRFDPTGEKFDPAVHEAMFELPDPTKPAGSVAQVIEAGYMIGERVLRPARVGVARGGPPMKAAEPAEDTGEAVAPQPQPEPQPQATPEPAQAGNDAAEGAAPEQPETDDAAGADVGARIDRTA